MLSGQPDKPIVIIGAGIAGVSTAVWLGRHGRRSIIIDRGAPGDGTSFGNAGVLAASSVLPVTVPGLLSRIPRYLLDPGFPLYVIWHRVPGITPWLVRYLRHATLPETHRISRGIAEIVTDALDQHRDLAGGTRAEKWLAAANYAYAYGSRAAFEQDNFGWSFRRDAGFAPQMVEGDAVQDYMPGASDAIRCMAVMDRHGFILDPGGYVKALAAEAEASGCRVVRASVRELVLDDGRVRCVATDNGPVECDTAVLAAGVWSRTLLEKLGVTVPMEAERGYHVLFSEPSCKPKIPVMVSAGKFVMTPMTAGLRCAGVVEFGGLSPGPSKKPLELIRKQTRMVYPHFHSGTEHEWLGHRPAPSDSLPFIGEIGHSGVYTAFGHHHIGLTAGPKTGRAIAQLITGGENILDLNTYNPCRFSQHAV